ncbi:hypothetical protein QTP88_025691 [Uroleucon formosanum]
MHISNKLFSRQLIFRIEMNKVISSFNSSVSISYFPSVTGSRSSGRAIGVVLLQPPPSPPSKMMKTSTTLRQGRRAQYYREDNHLFASRTMVVQKKNPPKNSHSLVTHHHLSYFTLIAKLFTVQNFFLFRNLTSNSQISLFN